jgi:hypothetical protein
MTACKNNNNQEFKDESKDASYTATLFRIDDWRVDLENSEREYYMTFIAYSKDYHAVINEEQVLYLADDGYKPIKEALSDISVETYNVVDGTKINGTCTYIKIKSPSIVDTKKIYVRIAGPSEYDPNATTVKDYVAIHGNEDGWRSVLCNPTQTSTKYDDIEELHNMINTNVIRVDADGSYPQFYYKRISDSAIVTDTEVYSEFDIVALNESDPAKLVSAIENNAVYIESIADDGTYKTMKVDENLIAFARIIDGKLQIGVKTKDGSEISQYTDKLPCAITYNYNLVAEMFVINNK